MRANELKHWLEFHRYFFHVSGIKGRVFMIFQNFCRGAPVIWASSLVLGLSACGGGSSPAAVAVPGAPTIGAATPDRASASVRMAFTPPASDGGAPITGYKATCTQADEGPFGTAATSPVVLWFGESVSSPVTVTGLTRGASYNCTVRASNSAGTSASSAPVSVSLAGP
jgi:hypothetical protein